MLWFFGSHCPDVLVTCTDRYRSTALKKPGFCFEGKMAVLDVCETNVRIGHVLFLWGKWRMAGYSALITVSSHLQ